MKFLLAGLLLTCSFYATAFHAVTEVLPSGKVLVCRDFDQVMKGNVVETYRLKNPGSKTDQTKVKVSEKKVPSSGDKIKFYRQESKLKNRLSNEIIEVELGEGVVFDTNLLGEVKSITNYRTRDAFAREEKIAIDQKEAKRIAEECVVVAPSNEIKVEVGDLVKF